MLLNLPIDSIIKSQAFIPRTVFSKVSPTSLKTRSKLAAVSTDALSRILDLDAESVADSELFVDFVSGNAVLSGSVPLAHRYGGHQFGSWANQLGDGRAVLLGEYINSHGEYWELQLKGSGKTPYSRAGDGRAVIRSSVREFLASEAMFHLGIPTSRAAALVVSDDPVYRDQFYDGHMKTERAAVVLRLAPSWFRIGSLEILARNGEHDELKQLVEFVLQHYFHAYITPKEYGQDDYIQLYGIIVNQTADLMAKWQSVGFAHGVCNTDNFSLLSITIDYGPFGFLDAYDPNFIPNSSDDEGRYAYKKQPEVGFFNLNKLREAMLPLIQSPAQLDAALEKYWNRFYRAYNREFMKKFGVIREHQDSQKLIAVFLDILTATGADFTASFRQLNLLLLAEDVVQIPTDAWALHKASRHKKWNYFTSLYRNIALDIRLSDSERINVINSTNPVYILRNWMAQQAIMTAEQDDFSEVNDLWQILRTPYTEQAYAEKRGFSRESPKWAKYLKVSCSS
ncbi:protein adenylyltransferase SelO, mitochondrial-like [Paramacrobiotus metropolitanus]|uniref:protein adenylyltransferase SelO, mitochondrial-like n=1 Tax=Paramacrobiotus metropolitanus TaxID=2943436 RepID=UPI002445A5DC|nr:protein adenylyltransferase SelO, mitochondrial-like [Paramacrobiotus metropolitanus]